MNLIKSIAFLGISWRCPVELQESCLVGEYWGDSGYNLKCSSGSFLVKAKRSSSTCQLFANLALEEIHLFIANQVCESSNSIRRIFTDFFKVEGFSTSSTEQRKQHFQTKPGFFSIGKKNINTARSTKIRSSFSILRPFLLYIGIFSQTLGAVVHGSSKTHAMLYAKILQSHGISKPFLVHALPSTSLFSNCAERRTALSLKPKLLCVFLLKYCCACLQMTKQ